MPSASPVWYRHNWLISWVGHRNRRSRIIDGDYASYLEAIYLSVLASIQRHLPPCTLPASELEARFQPTLYQDSGYLIKRDKVDRKDPAGSVTRLLSYYHTYKSRFLLQV